MPFKAIGRVASVYGIAVTFERAESASELRPGDVFTLAVDSDGERPRYGRHEVVASNPDTGVCWTEIAVKDVTPAACEGDYIIVAERDQRWSPYR